MKLPSPQMKFAAYFAVLAVFSALSLGTIFRYEKNRVARHGTDWASARTSYGQLPLSFEENIGQTDSRVRFVSRGAAYELFLTPEEAVLALRHPAQPTATSARDSALRRRRHTQRSSEPAHSASVVRIRFAGANPAAEIVGADKLPGRVDYFTGNNPKNWHTEVPSYSRVQYRSVYPGVDLVFYGNQRQLEYDFVVAPEADPKSIVLEVQGSSALRIDSNGNLLIGVQDGELEFHRPIVYQQVHGTRREVSATYALADPNRVTFAVSDYDRTSPLVIDPVLNYSTYIGGTNNDFADGIAVDSQGRACIAGQTYSTDFPIPTGVHTLPNGAGANIATWGNVFVSVFTPDGSGLVYSAYLSGDGVGAGPDYANGIAVDPSNNIYVTGLTFSDDFPVTTSGLITTAPMGNPFGTAFLTKINPSATGPASLLYSTYLGGSGNASTQIGDYGAAVAVDANGNAYVVGGTTSIDFPTMNPLPSPPNFAGLPNALGSAFVTRIDTTKSGKASLIYSTFLGGNGANGKGFADGGVGVAVDSSSNAYVAGVTTSSGNTFPTTASALQDSANASNVKGGAFFSKINTAASGSASLVYSTYLEGDTLDEGQALALGPNGIVYITGYTSSSNFPTTNTTSTSTLPNGVFPSAPNTAIGVSFLTLIDPSKSGANSLQYSVLLGGTSATGTSVSVATGTSYGSVAFGVQADTSGNAYLAGETNASDFPITFGAFQTAKPNPGGDAFIAKIDPAGNGTADLAYSSYFGGAGPSGGVSPDQVLAIALDTATPPNVYIAGDTASAATGPTPFPVTAGAFQTSLAGNGTTTDAFVAKLTLQPRVSVTPASINFGNVVILTTSPPQTITVTNNTSAMLTGLSFATTGGNSGDFAAAPGGGTPCGSTLASGASCTVHVTFKPSALAAEATTLDVHDSDSSSPQTVALSGTGGVLPGFTVTAPATASVTQGMSTSFTVTVTPVNGFNQNVTLSCGSLPMFATCTPNPEMVSLADGKTAQASTITIDTSATSTAGDVQMPTQIPPFVAAIGIFLIAISTLVTAASRRSPITLALGALITLFFLAGCSGHHQNVTPTGTTNITITETAGNTIKSTQVMLTVTAP